MNYSNTETALIFPGQGSQIVGMGKNLYDNFSVARDVFDVVDQVLKFDLSDIIFNGSKHDLSKTENTQPALMAVSIAIIKILEHEFGKKIQDLAAFVAGHSLGEYSALCASKAISLEDTIKLLKIRARAMSNCSAKTEGIMCAVLGAKIDKIKEVINNLEKNNICQIANDNSEGQVVISGSKVGVEKVINIIKENNIGKMYHFTC